MVVNACTVHLPYTYQNGQKCQTHCILHLCTGKKKKNQYMLWIYKIISVLQVAKQI